MSTAGLRWKLQIILCMDDLAMTSLTYDDMLHKPSRNIFDSYLSEDSYKSFNNEQLTLHSLVSRFRTFFLSQENHLRSRFVSLEAIRYQEENRR